MNGPTTPATGGLMTPQEAAAWLQVARGTLDKWRCHGTGPAFVYMGRHIRYRLADLEAHAASQTRRHTRDEGPEA
ncbi:MAG: helix-turn-helix domain-containing protein [Candidatus Sericytochromatia bacterium]|nr:helix-turn-helix domain-containing protein [Candidatus Sericytochromatia bacterium]